MRVSNATFAAAGVGLLGVLIYCLVFAPGAPWPANTVRAASATTVPVSQYPALTRQHFMNSCITSGGTQSSCACAIDGIQAHYSLQDFVAFDARAKSGEHMPADLVRIVSTCNAAASH